MGTVLYFLMMLTTINPSGEVYYINIPYKIEGLGFNDAALFCEREISQEKKDLISDKHIVLSATCRDIDKLAYDHLIVKWEKQIIEGIK